MQEITSEERENAIMAHHGLLMNDPEDSADFVANLEEIVDDETGQD